MRLFPDAGREIAGFSAILRKAIASGADLALRFAQ
jgi:hypothetical protein